MKLQKGHTLPFHCLCGANCISSLSFSLIATFRVCLVEDKLRQRVWQELSLGQKV